MYRLLGGPKTRTRRVAWMLEELALDYDWVAVAPASSEARRYNPSGKVPALEVDGTMVVDSVAIVQYLADRHGQFTYPAGTLSRAEQDSFTQFCCDEVDGPLWTLGKSRFALPRVYRVPEIRKSVTFEFARAMTTLAARLGERTYVMGDQFTVPDILLGQCAGWAGRAGLDLPDGKISAYFKRVQARPALARAFEREARLE